MGFPPCNFRSVAILVVCTASNRWPVRTLAFRRPIEADSSSIVSQFDSGLLDSEFTESSVGYTERGVFGRLEREQPIYSSNSTTLDYLRRHHSRQGYFPVG
jgi:hypothetical protein